MYKAYDYFTRQLVAKNEDKQALIKECLDCGICHDIVIVNPDRTWSWLTENLDK